VSSWCLTAALDGHGGLAETNYTVCEVCETRLLSYIQQLTRAQAVLIAASNLPFTLELLVSTMVCTSAVIQQTVSAESCQLSVQETRGRTLYVPVHQRIQAATNESLNCSTQASNNHFAIIYERWPVQELAMQFNLTLLHHCAAALSQQLQALRIRAMASSYLAPGRGWGGLHQQAHARPRGEVCSLPVR